MPAQKQNYRRGFTLVEVLVAITIVVVLSSVGFVTYSNAQVSSRDARRKQDLKALQAALEFYYQTNKAYPIGGWLYSNGTSNWLTGLNTNYINSQPNDPKANGGQPYYDNSGYGYAYWAAGTCASYPAGQFYVLVTQLENTNDPTNLGHADVKWCDGNLLHAYYKWGANSYVVMSQLSQ